MASHSSTILFILLVASGSHAAQLARFLENSITSRQSYKEFPSAEALRIEQQAGQWWEDASSDLDLRWHGRAVRRLLQATDATHPDVGDNQAREIRVTTRLAGVRSSEFEMHKGGFQSEIANLFDSESLSADNVVIIRFTNDTEGRNTEAAGVLLVEYIINGFVRTPLAEAVKVLHESTDQLLQGLQSVGFVFVADVEHQIRQPANMSLAPPGDALTGNEAQTAQDAAGGHSISPVIFAGIVLGVLAGIVLSSFLILRLRRSFVCGLRSQSNDEEAQKPQGDEAVEGVEGKLMYQNGDLTPPPDATSSGSMGPLLFSRVRLEGEGYDDPDLISDPERAANILNDSLMRLESMRQRTELLSPIRQPPAPTPGTPSAPPLDLDGREECTLQSKELPKGGLTLDADGVVRPKALSACNPYENARVVRVTSGPQQSSAATSSSSELSGENDPDLMNDPQLIATDEPAPESTKDGVDALVARLEDTFSRLTQLGNLKVWGSKDGAEAAAENASFSSSISSLSSLATVPSLSALPSFNDLLSGFDNGNTSGSAAPRTRTFAATNLRRAPNTDGDDDCDVPAARSPSVLPDAAPDRSPPVVPRRLRSGWKPRPASAPAGHVLRGAQAAELVDGQTKMEPEFSAASIAEHCDAQTLREALARVESRRRGRSRKEGSPTRREGRRSRGRGSGHSEAGGQQELTTVSAMKRRWEAAGAGEQAGLSDVEISRVSPTNSSGRKAVSWSRHIDVRPMVRSEWSSPAKR